MAIAHVQSTSNYVSVAAADNAKAFAGNNTAGNLIVVSIHWAAIARTLSSVVDSAGNTYYEAVTVDTDTGVALSIWYAMNCVGGANTVTVTWSGATISTIAIHEYSGLLTSGALDKTASADSGGVAGTSASSGSTATTTVATELVFGATASANNAGGFTAGADFTERTDNARHESEDRIVAAKAAYAASSTFVNSVLWVCQVATFKGVESPTVSGVAATTSSVEVVSPRASGDALVTGVAAETSAAGQAPAVTAGAAVTGVAAEASAAGQTPAVTAGASVTGVAAEASAAGQAPAVGTDNPVTVNAVPATATAAAGVPSITNGDRQRLNASASSRDARPCLKLLVDWAGAGFSDIASWTDESAYVQSARGEMSATGDRKTLSLLGQGVAGSCTLTLDNPVEASPNSGLRFSPTNSAGSLYTYIGSGKVRFIRAQVSAGYYYGGTAVYTEMITGYIVDLRESTSQRQVTMEIRDRAAVAATQRASTEVLENVSARAIVEDWIDKLSRDDWAAGERKVDLGIALHRYAWLDQDQESVWGALGKLAEAHGGRVWVDRAGTLHWEDMTHLMKPDADVEDNPLQVQAAFTVASFGACDPRYLPEDVINEVELKYVPVYRGPRDVVWTAPEVYAVAPGGGTLDVEAEFGDPALSLETATAWDEDTELGDYRAVTAGRRDITSDVAIAVTNACAQRATVTLTNNNADYVAYFVRLQLRGTPLLSEEAITIKRTDSTSMAQYGTQSWAASNDYIVSRAQAEALAEHVLWRFKDPPLRMTLRGVPALPYLEPGNRVSVTEANIGLSAIEFFISKLTWALDEAFTQTLELVKAANVTGTASWFIVGTSKWGGSGTTGSGQLGW